MAVKASATVTISCYRDTESTTRYYKLQSSTSTAPSKPTVKPPPTGWDDAEPSYTGGSTNTLYFCDLTVFSDGTWSYSTVSKSSSYEAAKAAYNKAQNAQNTADEAQAKIEEVSNALEASDDVIIGTQTSATGSWTGVAKFAELKDGQRIAYWLPYAGSGNATLNLTLSNGSTTGAIACYRQGTSRITTHYPAGSLIYLTYRKDVSIAGSSTKYTGWWSSAAYDSGNTYDRTRYSQAIKAGAAIKAYNIIVGKNGLYTHLNTGNSFDISYPILYANSSIAASATGTNNYLAIPFTVTTTQSITLTTYKPVYVKGTLSGSLFTPVSATPLTQTVPTSEDGYWYILLGTSYSSTAMYLLNEHPIFKYYKDGFKTVEQIAAEAASNIDNLAIGGRNLLIGTSDEYIEKDTGQWYVKITEYPTEYNTLENFGLKAGDEITYRVQINGGEHGARARLTFYSDDSGSDKITVTGNVIAAGEEGYSVITIAIPSTSAYISIGIQNGDTTQTSNLIKYRCPKLEKGNRATDWTPATEDMATAEALETTDTAMSELADQVDARIAATETDIDTVNQVISNLIVDENGGSLMKQTTDGWIFSMAETMSQLQQATDDLKTLESDLDDQGGNIEALQNVVSNLETLTSYVRVTTEGSEPCIELGNTGSFKVRITNTAIEFMDGTSIPAYVNNQSLKIDKAEVENELAFGGFAFKERDNGNMGLIWKG